MNIIFSQIQCNHSLNLSSYGTNRLTSYWMALYLPTEICMDKYFKAARSHIQSANDGGFEALKSMNKNILPML